MTPQRSSPSINAADGKSYFSNCHSLLAILAIVFLWLLPFRMIHATDYCHLGLGEMVEAADLIIIAELKPSQDKLNARVETILKGKLPEGFEFSGSLAIDPADGKVSEFSYFGSDTRVKLTDLIPSNRRIFFLRKDRDDHFRTFHPACILNEAEKQRVSEVIAMTMDLAPFVREMKYAGDLDLIFLLGERFFALRVIAPAIPELEHYMAKHREIPDEVPWQRTRLTMQFTYEESRQPMLQMEPLVAQGVLADFIRKMAAFGVVERLQKTSKTKLPPTFSVIVDTYGPGKVGELSFQDAATFLHKQLESKDVGVVTAAFGALAKMMDPEAIQIANSMITYPDKKVKAQAAMILGYARDSSSIDSIRSAVEFLPPYVSRELPTHDRDMDNLIYALGQATRKHNDPKVVPVLKQLMYKGYAGHSFARTLARLGDESAFEPIFYHIRNPYVEHYPENLVTLIKRSNLPTEPWMSEGFSSNDTAGKKRHAEQWIAWWDTHKAAFRVVRTWEEVSRLEN